MAIRYFAIAAGVVYLLVGLMGFVPGLNVQGPPEAPPLAIENFYGYLLGLFPVNVLHNIVHLAIGAWGVAGYMNGVSGSRAFARGLAVVYAILAVMGLIPTLNTMFGLVPLFGHDVWLHAGTAALAAYFGWFHRGDYGHRTGHHDSVTDRARETVGHR
jgi:hypothetical protein